MRPGPVQFIGVLRLRDSFALWREAFTPLRMTVWRVGGEHHPAARYTWVREVNSRGRLFLHASLLPIPGYAEAACDRGWGLLVGWFFLRIAPTTPTISSMAPAPEIAPSRIPCW